MATTFAFIGYDPNIKKPGKSLEIRSRCMQGKNKRQGSRRSKQELRKASKKGKDTSSKAQQPIAFVEPPIPASIDRTLACFDLVDIDTSEKDLVFRTITRDIVDHTLSHLDICVNFGGVETPSYEWLLSSDLFLQLTLCAAYAFTDFTNPQWNGKPSHRTLLHQQSTLHLLQKRLFDEDAYLDDSLVRIIVTLALLGGIFGDWIAGANHFIGLRKIIQLRGDGMFLNERPKLHLLLDRIDLARSLTQGMKPLLPQPVISWEPVLPPPRQHAGQPTLFRPPLEWDSRLVTAFLDFQSLSCTISRNASSPLRYSAARFQDIIGSLQSRLIAAARFLEEDPTQRLVLLTLLALLTPITHVPGPKPPYFWVLEQFRRTYPRAVVDGGLEQEEDLHLWVLVTVALIQNDVCEEWVVEAWNGVGFGLDWASLRQRLMSVVWIGVIHDKIGEVAFRELNGIQHL